MVRVSAANYIHKGFNLDFLNSASTKTWYNQAKQHNSPPSKFEMLQFLCLLQLFLSIINILDDIFHMQTATVHMTEQANNQHCTGKQMTVFSNTAVVFVTWENILFGLAKARLMPKEINKFAVDHHHRRPTTPHTNF